MFKRITAQFKKHKCPYCFEDFNLRDTSFRCKNDPRVCPPEPDEVYKKQWNVPLPMGKVIKPKGGFWGGYSKHRKCLSCSQTSYERLCPHCHSNLPHAIGEQEDYIFAIIGAKDTGKSHYLAVLIEQLTKVVGPAHNMLLEPLNDETLRRYREEFYNPIYVKHGTLDGTFSAQINKAVRQPLVYRLSVTAKNYNGDRVIDKAVTLVFYDSAGEDLNSKDNMSIVNKYISRSDGIIVLIDPLQLTYVREQLPASTPLPDINSETTDILSRTTQLIEESRHLNGTDRIKTPLAVSFSKFDAVLSLIDEQSQLHGHANHDNGYDQDDFEAVNSEMLSLLRVWGCHDILNITQTRYKQVGFFGLSALGCNPDDSRKVTRVSPRRVEDPLLWLLAINNIIRGGDADES